MSSSGVGDGSILPGSSLEPFLELGRPVDDIDKFLLVFGNLKVVVVDVPAKRGHLELLVWPPFLIHL